ncbi:MAG: HEAT repeat domain-containing protein, partial [Phycisphaeraceae bacterium]
PLAATMLGPKATIATHRNLRWRFTLCRQFDGSFTLHSNYGKENLRNPTATYVLHYSAPMKQTLWTGKDVETAMLWNDDEFADLLTIAQGQFNDPQLIEQAGPPVTQRSTDEVLKYLGVFKPKMRRAVAGELAKRYQAGEKDILPRLAKLLESENPRERGGACRALEACGPDATMQYLSGVAKLLNDDYEFVRMRAVATIAKATDSAEMKAAVLQSNIEHLDTETMSPNSVGSITQSVLFGADSLLASKPFDAGIEHELVRDALEKLITLDPAGNRPLLGNKALQWDKDTAARLAGPLLYAAEQEQIADQMFSSRRSNTLKYLAKLGYQESIDASASYLHRYLQIPRQIRPKVSYKRGQVVAQNLMAKPGHAKHHLDDMYRWMLDKPLDFAFAGNKDEDPIKLYVLINAIEAAQAEPEMPRLADDAERFFASQLETLGSDSERAALCRRHLKAVDARDMFRKLNALSYLAKTQGADALKDVLPYLGHSDRHLAKHAKTLTVGLVVEHGDQVLIDAFASAQKHRAIAILEVLAQAKTIAGMELVRKALAHEVPAVRGSAAKAIISLGGEKALSGLLYAMQKETRPEALAGYEQAVLLLVDQPSAVDLIRSRSIAMLPTSTPPLRDSLLWLIAQVGGEPAMAVLSDLLQDDSDEQLFREVITALSYSPDPAADQLILNAIQTNAQAKQNRVAAARTEYAADEGIRRMVIAKQGLGKRPIEEQLDYAETVLKTVLNKDTLEYLGRIKTGRCAYILQDAMRRGAPASAGQAIVEATADLSNASKKDKQLGESALVDVIEFIEVTYIRGTAEDYLDKHVDAQRRYIRWKTISAQAGKNLLKLTNSKEPEPLPEFDDSDLDF